MRTLSKKTQYTLRAMYALSRHFGSGPMLISDLATQESIPKKFLEQILLKLKGGGFVMSKKGKGGGYSLAHPPETITVGQIIRLVDGPLAPLPCASETAYRKCDECVDDRFCETKIVMRQVRDATAQILDKTSLADLVRRADTAKSDAMQHEAGAVMYYI